MYFSCGIVLLNVVHVLDMYIWLCEIEINPLFL